jgi:SAM-dependent methyltransferase
MAKRRILVANCYDYPQYYDIAFQAYTQREADFIDAACRKYCPFVARRLVEPACGTGRLISELAARGYQMIGFDLSEPALRYLRRRLARRLLHAETFQAEMSNFRLARPVDAAYCTVNTFRHLLTEQAARGHLKCIADSLRPGGIYILGLHLLPLDGKQENVWHWTEQRRETKVTITLRSRRPSPQMGLEVCVFRCVGVRNRLCAEFQFRTYTAAIPKAARLIPPLSRTTSAIAMTIAAARPE